MIMRNYLKISLYSIFFLAILAGFIAIFYPILTALPDPNVNPPAGSKLGSKTVIEITFPVLMNEKSVESRLSLPQNFEYQNKWKGMTLQVVPSEGFSTGSKVEISLKSGSSSLDGRKYSSGFSWSFTIRQPDIVFLGNATSSPEIWLYNAETGQIKPLTETGGRITDLAASPQGDTILYTQKNDLGGSDLFTISRIDQIPHLLVTCGKDNCIDPAISNDGSIFAFSRNKDPEDGGSGKFSYIYTGTVDQGEKSVTALIPEKNIPGILPSFSPDGKKIAFYDSTSKGIRIENNAGNNDFLLGTNRIQRGSWSADGNNLIIIDDESGTEGLHSRLFVIDVMKSSLSEPVKDLIQDKELGEPDWSPDGTKIVAGVRSEGGPVARQLEVIDLKSNKVMKITEDLTVMNAAPKWSADGKQIVFQQARLGESNIKPVVAVWNSLDGSMKTIAEDAALPEWLP